MALTDAEYLAQLQALLPPGAAWSRSPEATLTRVLHALAEALARVDARAAVLIEEADPRTTSELLTDWERVFGLPDECIVAQGITQTVQQRIAALMQAVTGQGGQSAEYYVQLAAGAGYGISITEFTQHDVTDDVEHPLYNLPWQFTWQVNTALNGAVGYFTVESSTDEPLAWWGDELLECVIWRLKPAHTHVLFSYT